MKHQLKAAILSILLLGGMAATGNALAYGHFHGGVGIYVGPGFGYGYGPGYYPYGYGYAPYPYYPPAAYYPPVVAPAPTTYIERAPVADPQQAAPASGYWYYCANPQGYYPAVQSCPTQWQKVLPRPAN